MIMKKADNNLDAVDRLKDFNVYLRDVRARYEGNLEVIRLREQDTQDILHEIELGPKRQSRQCGALYKKLREICKERRAAKMENEQLEPIMQWLRDNPNMIGVIGQLQGSVRAIREKQASRVYTPRGDAAEL